MSKLKAECALREGKRLVNLWVSLAGVAALLAGTRPAEAHKINTSYTTMIVRSDTLKLMVVIDEYDLLQNFDLDKNDDQMLWRDEILDGVEVVFDYVERNLSLSADGKPVWLQRSKGDAQPDNKGNMLIHLFFRASLGEPPTKVEMTIDFFDEFGSEHKTLAKILMPGKPLQQAVFSEKNPCQDFLVGEKEVSLVDQLLQLIRQVFE